jgi:hypothetical protein
LPLRPAITGSREVFRHWSGDLFGVNIADQLPSAVLEVGQCDVYITGKFLIIRN